jgi:CBS domain-containing protein
MLRRLIPDVVQKQDLATLPGSATVREAAALMRSRHIGSVLIVAADGKLEGIFTERDVVCRVVADHKNPDKTKLRTVMTAQPECASPDMTAIEALRCMHDGGFRHLPVVKDGRPVAVVSRRDFFGAEKARVDEENEIWAHIR